MTKSIFFAAFLAFIGCGPDAAHPCKSGDNTCVHFPGGTDDASANPTPADMASKRGGGDLASASGGDLASAPADMAGASDDLSGVVSDLSSSLPDLSLLPPGSDLACLPDGAPCTKATHATCCTNWCNLTTGQCGPYGSH